MEFFIDSADINEIREIAAWGILSGATTNPTLVSKSGANFKDRVIEICNVIDGPISAEVTGLTAEEMLKEAEDIVTWHPNVIIKVPTIPEGLKTVSALSKRGVKTNATLVFNPTQALLMARAGATYVSPFVGRLDDIGDDGIGLIRDIADIFLAHGIETQVLAASLRNMRHVTDAALAGADVATLPYALFKQMITHPLTDAGLKKFLADWETRKQ